MSRLIAKKRSMPSNAKNSGCNGEGILVPASECLVSFYLSRMNSESKSEFCIKLDPLKENKSSVVIHHTDTFKATISLEEPQLRFQGVYEFVSLTFQRDQRGNYL